MAIKHVKEYFHQIEKMYWDLNASLIEMKEDFERGEATEEQLNNLLTPVSGIQQQYMQLAYLMHLLYQPTKKENADKFKKRNKILEQYFEDKHLTKEQMLERDADALKLFKEKLKNGEI